MAMTFKERLQATLRQYELNRAKLAEYTEELELSLKKHYNGKVGRCLANLVLAQAEYCDSLKAEVVKWYKLAILPENKTDDTAYYAMTAEELVEAKKQAATRASHAAGLIEQAKTASTERETLDALANFDANFHTKGHAVLKEWHAAIDYFKFESIATICERNFLEKKELTVGDYLELSAQNKNSRSEATNYLEVKVPA
mgnify:CR=1 FL=1